LSKHITSHIKLILNLQQQIDSHELKRLINHLSKLKGFEFVIDPNYDCKINVRSVRNTKGDKI